MGEYVYNILLGSLLLLSFFIIYGIIFYFVELKNVRKAKAEIDCYCDDKGNLYVHSPNPMFSKLLTVKLLSSKRLTYTPEKYIYTSATVGGITTGGVTKIGGYDDKKHKTTKRELLYKEIELSDKGVETVKYKLVKRIVLVDEELLKEAKKSQIKEHIDGKNIIVVKEPNISSAIQYMSGVNAANYYANCVEEGYPSEEYCNQIINWLCKKSAVTQEYENRTKASVSLIIFSFILSVVLMFLVGIFNIVAGFVAALVITLIAVSILIKYLIENIKAKRISGIVIEMLSIIVCLSINIGVCYYFLINLS